MKQARSVELNLITIKVALIQCTSADQQKDKGKSHKELGDKGNDLFESFPAFPFLLPSISIPIPSH